MKNGTPAPTAASTRFDRSVLVEPCAGGQHDVFAADHHRYLTETGIDARGRPWLPARREDVDVLRHVRHAGRSRLLQQQLAQLWLLGWFWLAVLADWVGEFIGTREVINDTRRNIA